MNMHINDAEGRALHGLLEEAAGDIVLRLDSSGFVLHASANATELGIDLTSLLVMPHISDFAEQGYGDAVARHVGTVLGYGDSQRQSCSMVGNRGSTTVHRSSPLGNAAPIVDGLHERGGSGGKEGQDGRWIEFPLLQHGGGRRTARASRRRWYALSLRPIAPDDGVPQGALALLRTVERHHRLQGLARARPSSDPCTGLDNRRAFCNRLRRHFAASTAGCVAVLAIDRMQSITLQYGQNAADEIRWGFARFLEAMVQPEHNLAQLDAERFAVILPGMSIREATAWAEDVLRTFATLTDTSSLTKEPRLSASAGVARAELNTEWTLRQAELGLIMARAGGGMRAAARGKRRGLREAGPLPRIVPESSERLGEELDVRPVSSTNQRAYAIVVDRSAA